MRIIVSGMLVGDPYQGGATWAVLQYLLGFQRLGHEVYLIEPVRYADGETLDYFQQVTAEFQLAGRAALLKSGTQETIGLSYDQLQEICRRTQLLINISGMLADRSLLHLIPTRVYLDIDPGFNQLWHAAQGIEMRFEGHTHHVTIGLSLGQPDCPVPTCGYQWLTSLQPIVLEQWPVADKVHHDAFTTIGNWRGYGSIQYNDQFYGQKAHSLRQFIDLPTRTKENFLLAVSIHGDEKKDLAALEANGWKLISPRNAAGTPGEYRQFIQGSKAEFGIAKSGYVVSRCGWFSDRSICYLASGRPVVAQETGFSQFLPTGHGLFAFRTTDDVLAALDEINADYSAHARAARELAAEFFDSDKVLSRLLEKVS